MKIDRHSFENTVERDNIPPLYCGVPQGDELPQVAGVEDILMDVYSDILNMPREYAAGCFHHQFDNDFAYEDDIIH